jgi:hypothetical protein
MKWENAVPGKVIPVNFMSVTKTFREDKNFQSFDKLWHISGNSGSVPIFSFSDIFSPFFKEIIFRFMIVNNNISARHFKELFILLP